MIENTTSFNRAESGYGDYVPIPFGLQQRRRVGQLEGWVCRVFG
jgi:hypothetical protein